MSMYTALIPQAAKMLRNLDACLEKAIVHAKEKDFDVERLLATRLAPDHFSLSRHVQATCDMAKFGASRLADKKSPAHEDSEAPMSEIRARIAEVIGFLESISAADFEQAPKREIQLPFLKGQGLRGADHLNEFVLPNFYFHLTCVYALLRQNGVPLAKTDFLGSLNTYELSK